MPPYLIVTGDLVQSGGMDMANLALARHLANNDHEVHIVAHRVSSDLEHHRRVHFHRVPKPANSYALGSYFLNRTGRHWARTVSAQRGRVIVNGGNCSWDDANWIHYVHALYRPPDSGGRAQAIRASLKHRKFIREEHRAVSRARVVVVNSKKTGRDVIEHLELARDRVRVVYYGCDAARFHIRGPEARRTAAAKLSWPLDRPCLAFIGALSDPRKGFDTAFKAWTQLCADPKWDVDLAVVGNGADQDVWKAKAAQRGMGSRVHFLGFQQDTAPILAACSGLVSPVRYEAFGLAAQEALCNGLPAFISKSAGIAELYPKELDHLLLPDPDDATDLANRLRAWRARPEYYEQAVISSLQPMRSRTWDHMAAQIVEVLSASDVDSHR